MNPFLVRAYDAYRLPLLELVHCAQKIHREYHDPEHIQLCQLLSIKTGGCPEDCAYCPQSAHHRTGIARQALISVDQVRTAATEAKHAGAERFCMGAAWRSPSDGSEFDRVLDMVRAVKALGLEACATLGMLAPDQARRLKAAGLDAYNHNLDTSRDYYGKIITTRTYDDRLRTLQAVREAGITVCCGGILGLGESEQDRCVMLAELAAMEPQPESVPINLLVPVPGTPLESKAAVDPLDLVRVIGVARILMPRARIRLSAGRESLSDEAQVLAFLAGANSIFLGEKLLTQANPALSDDQEFFDKIGRRALNPDA